MYIKTRIGGKAYNYFLLYLEVEREVGRNPTSKEILKFLDLPVLIYRKEPIY